MAALHSDSSDNAGFSKWHCHFRATFESMALGLNPKMKSAAILVVRGFASVLPRTGGLSQGLYRKGN
jgi:hypothetical protein